VKRLGFPFLLCTVSLSLYAADSLPGLKFDQITLSGYGSFVNTRVMKFYNSNIERPPQWNNFAVLNLVLNMNFGKGFAGHIGIEGFTWHNTISTNNALMPVNKELMNWTLYPHQIEGDYAFGNPGDFHGEFCAGLMPYKYNHDAWNLGEYLFRSGTYPGYLITNFDWTTARLTGFRLSTRSSGSWHNDFLLTINMELPPFHDGAISWLSDYSFANIITVGGGVSLCSILSAGDRFTTPINRDNMIIVSDTVNNTITSDTSYYTFKGIKAMARLSIDTKVLLPKNGIPSFFGREDCKLYAELAVLGVQNQGACYDKLVERMPIMAGFNFPAFNFLDVISCQMEYYQSPYPNDYGNTFTYSQPGFAAPISYNDQQNPSPRLEQYKHDNWKWSVYVNKFFGPSKHFGIVGQAARDHWRTMSTFEGNRDYGDALIKTRHWYWATKLVMVF
jgi:hypothetical protein